MQNEETGSFEASMKRFILFVVGGAIYIVIEMLWRGYSHWAMFFVGGFCFLLVGEINEVIPWEMAFWKQMLIGGAVVTTVELFSGIILNLVLKWHVWDYSKMPFNFLGQICLPFTLAWIGLSAVAIVLDDYLRYLWFDEEYPHYTWK